MPIKYVGRTTTFKGKPLWEILGNLKNYGVGRLVLRSRMQIYPEPCYMKILKVAALPDTTKHPHDARKVRVLVEKTFRGKTEPMPVQIESVSYKADYTLVPKDEEHRYFVKPVTPTIKILPRTMEFPPLMKEILIREAKKLNKTDIPQLPIKYNIRSMRNYKIAKEGETPTVDFNADIKASKSPHLYANIKYEDSP